MASNNTVSSQPKLVAGRTAFGILSAISLAYLLNDMIQSLVLALYPLLRAYFSLSFVQIGLITFIYQITAFLLQPVIGHYTDKHPLPWSLPVGMVFTLCGLLLLTLAPNFATVLMGAALVGIGSSIFHPESSRVARMASGGRYGLAQSIFQLGGNMGSSFGPLLAALVIDSFGHRSVAWFSLTVLLAIVVLLRISRWYMNQHFDSMDPSISPSSIVFLPRRKVFFAISILLVLVFSKYFYITSLSNFYTFYLMHKFGLSAQSAQLYLFAFLFSVAVGTVIGGLVGDSIGCKRVIWISVLGVAPFTLLLPHVTLEWIGALSVVIGFVLASAFSAILVYAQELIPGHVGLVSGLFFGFAFGIGGLGAVLLGLVADHQGIVRAYQICAYLPILGILTAFLPDNRYK